jgi:hypothetical protein
MTQLPVEAGVQSSMDGARNKEYVWLGLRNVADI